MSAIKAAQRLVFMFSVAMPLAVPLYLAGGDVALSQTMADISGPAEQPPANYSGRQYVDSQGCMFVSAGFGDVTTWVPRVTRDRKVLCGQRPGAAVASAETAPGAATEAPGLAAVAPDSAVTLAEPAPAPARRRVAVTLPAEPGKPRALRQVMAEAVPLSRATCPAGKPRRQFYQLSDGRKLLRCAPAADAPGAYRILGAAEGTAPPKGYAPAWKDGRLNPHRGPQTAEGNAAMARIWTDAVPAKAVDKPQPLVTAALSGQDHSRVPMQTGPGGYVQIGTFGVPANADGASARIAAMGLPVAVSATTMRGKSVQVVFAGPFSDPAAASRALSQIRANGFSDAFLKG